MQCRRRQRKFAGSASSPSRHSPVASAAPALSGGGQARAAADGGGLRAGHSDGVERLERAPSGGAGGPGVAGVPAAMSS